MANQASAARKKKAQITLSRCCWVRVSDKRFHKRKELDQSKEARSYAYWVGHNGASSWRDRIDTDSRPGSRWFFELRGRDWGAFQWKRRAAPGPKCRWCGGGCFALCCDLRVLGWQWLGLCHCGFLMHTLPTHGWGCPDSQSSLSVVISKPKYCQNVTSSCIILYKKYIFPLPLLPVFTNSFLCLFFFWYTLKNK